VRVTGRASFKYRRIAADRDKEGQKRVKRECCCHVNYAVSTPSRIFQLTVSSSRRRDWKIKVHRGSMEAVSVPLDAPLRNHLGGMSRIMMLSDSSSTIPEFSIAALPSEVQECFVITRRLRFYDPDNVEMRSNIYDCFTFQVNRNLLARVRNNMIETFLCWCSFVIAGII